MSNTRAAVGIKDKDPRIDDAVSMLMQGSAQLWIERERNSDLRKSATNLGKLSNNSLGCNGVTDLFTDSRGVWLTANCISWKARKEDDT